MDNEARANTTARPPLPLQYGLMSRPERDLEKAVKRVLRGDPVAVGDVADRWKELGPDGSRLMAQLLNRGGGWDALIRWAGSAPDARALLNGLSQFPGISGYGLRLLEEHGIDPPGPDAPSRRTLWIVEAAGREDSGDWVRARGMLRADPDVMEGALMLMEAEPSKSAAEFLDAALGEHLSQEQDHRVRKALYRIGQQGIAVSRKQDRAAIAEKEWWAFGENREPNLQFALCFRFHSSFASSGDLYILRIWEGHEVFPVEQEAGLQMNRSVFLEFCQRYSAHITQQVGVEVSMQPVPAEHAHFFLRKAVSFLPASSNPRPLADFLRFLGAGEGEDPFTTLQASAGGTDTVLMQHPYFQLWTIDPGDLQEFFENVKRLEQGPIILVGAPQAEQKRGAATAALVNYFDERRRALWANAFRKAAYFLRKQDQQAAASAMQVAAQFEDAAVGIDQLASAKILFESAVQLHAQMEQRKDQEAKETSLIVTPDEFARSQRPRGRS